MARSPTPYWGRVAGLGLRPMATYRVAFDGKWQGKFDEREDALEWAKDVSETGRMVWVARTRLLYRDLIAVFPEDQFEEGKHLWKSRAGMYGHRWAMSEEKVVDRTQRAGPARFWRSRAFTAVAACLLLLTVLAEGVLGNHTVAVVFGASF